jgi:2-oxoglutarate ferredoxin oxidoreductase subunit alpha
MKRIFKDDISIVICGEAGQGVQTVEKLLVQLFKSAGFNIFATKEYMSRVRGGSNSVELRVSSEKKRSYLRRIDMLIAIDKEALPHLSGRINEKTLIIGDNTVLGYAGEMVDAPFSKIASEEGNAIYSNTAAVGLVTSLFGIEFELVSGYLSSRFASKGAEMVSKNISAAKKGYEFGASISGPEKISVNVARNTIIKDEIVLSGAEAIALGAAAGGCDLVSAYPMTPSTGIFTFLAAHSDELGIVTEQAEDEISAINMAIGGWYAGARGFVITAGGGFALMAEAMSLAGMIESPLVVSVGQRPGPATGLPTRTEQSDLELVLYAGHGEFPRAVLAPGTVEEAFYLTQKAFNVADKYQVPIIILSDQYLVDCYYNLLVLDPVTVPIQKQIVKTAKDYKRYSYAVNADAVSPRGVPGYGEGLVHADSDEHDEDGHITEDSVTRKKMMDKRLAKLEFLKRATMPPEFYGPQDYETLVIGWGSTFGAIKEAMDNLANPKAAYLHFKQVYPLHVFAESYIKKAKKTIIVEGNATGQFAKIIKLYTGFEIQHKILKYDGIPFSVEEVEEELNKIAHSG